MYMTVMPLQEACARRRASERERECDPGIKREGCYTSNMRVNPEGGIAQSVRVRRQ
jgi:hypothetical protein